VAARRRRRTLQRVRVSARRPRCRRTGYEMAGFRPPPVQLHQPGSGDFRAAQEPVHLVLGTPAHRDHRVLVVALGRRPGLHVAGRVGQCQLACRTGSRPWTRRRCATGRPRPGCSRKGCPAWHQAPVRPWPRRRRSCPCRPANSRTRGPVGRRSRRSRAAPVPRPPAPCGRINPGQFASLLPALSLRGR
jgi:hypothetical protein